MNKNIFKSATNIKPVDTINNAGAPAYSLPDHEALAQLVVTGTFNNTFYVEAADMTKQVIELSNKVDPVYLAKMIVYARQEAYMKDSPALMLAILSIRNVSLFRKIAHKVLDNMKMVRNLVQVIRSGLCGRKSLGSAVKKEIQKYFNSLSDDKLFMQSIGQSPSIVDIIKLAHIKPNSENRQHLFRYLMGYPSSLNNPKNSKITYDFSKLSSLIQSFEAFKKDNSLPLPNVDWQMLSSFNLTKTNWINIGSNMNWHALRMNLNTLKRHDALENKELVSTICTKLSDKTTISKIKVFPYQIYNTYINIDSTIPAPIKNSIQDALDASIINVPKLSDIDKLFICVDISGSMASPVTGKNGSATTKATYLNVAAVFAAAFAKTNSHIETKIISFNYQAKEVNVNLRDSLVTIANTMFTAAGGTDCNSAAQYVLNSFLKKGDKIGIIFLSDNQSWVEYYYRNYNAVNLASPLSNTLNNIQKKVKTAKTVLIDISPTTSTQALSNNVLNVGGFSDAVFDVVSQFFKDNSTWVDIINNVSIDNKPVMTQEWVQD